MRIEEINKLVLANSSLVHRCLRGIKIPKLLTYQDLVQAGYEGLIYAGHHFKEDRGVKFCTYAMPCIRGNIMRTIYKNTSMVHIPEVTLFNLSKNNKTVSDLVDIEYLNENFAEHSNIEDKDDIENIENKLDYYFLKQLINKYRYKLTPKQFKAITTYYLNVTEGHKNTLSDVANEMGVSKERARQLIKNAIKNLQKAIGHLDVYI